MSASFIAFTGQQGLIHIADIGRYAQWRSIAACLILSIIGLYNYRHKYVGAYGSECSSVPMMMMIMMMICNL